jgi:hypothetical protein
MTTEVELIEYIRNSLNRSFPNDVSFTIGEVRGNILIPQSPIPSAANNGWQFGVLTITSGAGKDIFRIVTASTEDQLHLSGRFLPGRTPAPGDTAILTGDPLKSAVKIIDEPASISSYKDGFVIVLQPDFVEVEQRSLGSNVGRQVWDSTVGLDVEISAPYKVLQTPAAQKDYFASLSKCMEQVLVVLLDRRLDASVGWSGTGVVRIERVYLHREGSIFRRGYVIFIDYTMVR